MRSRANAAGDAIPILLYHRVGDHSDQLTVSVEHFRRDMQSLVDGGYRSLSLEQFRDFRAWRSSLPDKSVLITFDDGYIDNYTNAFPVLQAMSLAASFFVITGPEDPQNRMTPAQQREMAAYGMSFGSHTVSHRPLGEMVGAEAGRELVRSRQTLEDQLGRAVDFIAYPRGSYSAETLALAQQAGYQGGFTVKRGYATAAQADFELRRIPVYHSTRSLRYLMWKSELATWV